MKTESAIFIGFERILVRFVFMGMLFFLFSPAYGESSDKGMKQVENNRFWRTDKFIYFKEKLTVALLIRQQEPLYNLSGVLFKITSNDQSDRLFLIDWQKDASQADLFVLYNNSVKKYPIPVDSAFIRNKTPVRLDINFKTDEALFTLGNNSIVLHHLRFSIYNGYRFSLLPQLAYSDDPEFRPRLDVSGVTVQVSQSKVNSTVWIWFLVIICVDVIIFFLIHRVRRKRKGRFQHENDMVVQQPDALSEVVLPVKSAVYLFGRFHVYDARGEDITKSFSPLLKEILCLLIIYSQRNGISFDKLKEFLWADKGDASVRNNRAVYFGRLKGILEKLGTFDINNDTGYWKLRSSDIFIDYFRYKELLAKDSMNKADIEELLAVVSNGNLLPTTDYEWMDPFKDEASNETIETLLRVAANLNMQDDTRLILKLADIIFKFDYLNEHALYLKCKAYGVLGQHAGAKNAYDKFVEEYKRAYGTAFNVPFNDLDSKCTCHHRP